MKKVISLLVINILCCSCTILIRGIKYGSEDIDDYKIFPYSEMNPGNNVYRFKEGNKDILNNYIIKPQKRYDADTVNMTLNDFLEKTTTTVSFIVIRNDSILFEKYYRGYNRSQISTIFSISKSVTSMLVGLAIDDGYIKSVHDPITNYIPELKDGDPKFQRLTIEHLLNMRSGIKFTEEYSNPLSGVAKLYYGTNQLGKIKRMKFEYEPGTVHNYQSVSTALLGIAIERATGKGLAKYMEEKVWIPMGMENKATWSLDDKRHRSTKAFSGLNTTAIDLAKIGRLYLNNGNWNGTQIIDSAWVAKSVTPNERNGGYQYQWYSTSTGVINNAENRYSFPDSISAQKQMSTDSRFKHYTIWQDEMSNNRWRVTAYLNAYYGLGVMHQTLYIDPDKKIIVVRLGETSNIFYPSLIYGIVRDL